MKERLTEAALDLIWHNSYGATSVDAICERAGAAKGAFIISSSRSRNWQPRPWKRTGESGRWIWIAFFHRRFRLWRDWRATLILCHDRLAELQKNCGAVLGCPLFTLGSEVSTQDTPLRDKVQEILDRKVKYFESAIRDAHAQGLIVAPDAKAKARGYSPVSKGTLTQARIQNSVEPLRDFKDIALDFLGAKHVPSLQPREPLFANIIDD